MARTQYNSTVLDAAGDPVTGALVQVYVRGTNVPADAFKYDAGETVLGPNGFFEAPAGIIEVWLDTGKYDIVITDPQVPPRIGPRYVGYDSVPADEGAIPFEYLDAVTERQVIQIGMVIDWFRPVNSTMQPPAGFEICDGRQIPAGQHEFAGVINAAINVPDLRNKFIVGASWTNAEDSSGSSASDAAANAPGMRGVGGTNQRNFGHSHQINNHTHVAPNHRHDLSGHQHYMNHQHTYDYGAHSHSTSTGFYKTITVIQGGGSSVQFNAYGTGWDGRTTNEGGGIGTTNWTRDFTDGPSNNLSGYVYEGAQNTGNPSDRGTDGGTLANVDQRPAFYGLLKIIKVRRA